MSWCGAVGPVMLVAYIVVPAGTIVEVVACLDSTGQAE